MENVAQSTLLIRYQRIVTLAGLAGAVPLIVFRVLIELGLSPYGSLWVLGIPLEYLCLAWFFVLFALALERRRLTGDAHLRVTFYEWWLGVTALAGTIWLVGQLGAYRFVIAEAWVYPFACACGIAVFVSASLVERERRLAVVRNAIPDVIRILGRPATWMCTTLAVATIAAAPRSSDIPEGDEAFRRWYARQTRYLMPAEWSTRPVTLIEVTDYQCPVCRQAATRYREVLTNVRRQYGGSFAVRRVDFPLESECNEGQGPPGSPGPHPAACEAAAAVRLARMHLPDREEAVIEWLWNHQSQLTTQTVFDDIQKEFGLDVRRQYAAVLPSIIAEAAQARQLRVTGTPTYFLNGRRLPFLGAEALQTAIEIEMEAAGLGPQRVANDVTKH